MTKYFILGANSAIAREFSQLNAKNCTFFLAGRNLEKLKLQKQDLLCRDAKEVEICSYDANDGDTISQAVTLAFNKSKPVDIVLIAHGTLPKPNFDLSEDEYIREQIQTNAYSVIHAINKCAMKLAQQRHGTLAVITSVAGDRGRKSNFLYGAAKSMVTTYLQGVRAKLAGDNIQVLDIKPGMIDTPMTSDMQKGPLWASPDKVALDIDNAIKKRKDIIYSPGFWRVIMFLIKSLPEAISKRLSY